MSEITMESNNDFTTEEDRKDLVRFAVETLQTAKNFQLISALGQGAFGDVYKMYDPEREEDIAVKIVTPENTADLESTLWPRLEHRYILPLLEVLTLSPVDVTIFVMPVQQRSLYDLLYDKDFFNGPGCFNQVKEWMFEVLCALEYLSSNNLCHLDIKADNILISKQSTAMLCDFSFLNFTVTPLDRYSLGLPYIYRSPDVCRTQEEEVRVDGAAYDMWAYGVMSVEILTHFVIASKIRECDCWMNEVYPIVFDALQEEEFASLISHAFPADEIKEVDINLALNFIHIFLETDSLKRASAAFTKRHIFLNHGFGTGKIKGDIWINRKEDISPFNKEILKVNQTDLNDAGDVKTPLSSDSKSDAGHSSINLNDSEGGEYEELSQSNYEIVAERQTTVLSPEVKASTKQSSGKISKIENRYDTPKMGFKGNTISNSSRNVKDLDVSITNLESVPERVNNERQDTETTSLSCEEMHKHMNYQFLNDDSEFQPMWEESAYLNVEGTVSTKADSNKLLGTIKYPKEYPNSQSENKESGNTMYSQEFADETVGTQDALRSFGRDFLSVKCVKDTALGECCRGKFDIMDETKVKWTIEDILKLCEDESPLMNEKKIPSTFQLMSELSTNESTNIYKDIGIGKVKVLPETRTQRNILSKVRNIIEKFQKILTLGDCLCKKEKIHTNSSYGTEILDLKTPSKKISIFKSNDWIKSSINGKRPHKSRGMKFLHWFRRQCLELKCVCE